MPIKEFSCTACGHIFEDIKKVGDDTVAPCPQCDSLKVEPMISITGGYHMNSGPSSVRPRGAGSRPKRSK